jgi:single-strand DNA-binding protein
MADTSVTIAGNLTGDPELRFTPNGVPVASFSVAVTARIRKGDEWEDGETSFFRCSAWRNLAENVADSLSKGNRVLLTGTLKINKWEDENGVPRSAPDITVDEIGPSLKWAVTRSRKSSAGQKSDGDGAPEGNRRGRSKASSSSRRQADSKPTQGGSFDDDAPF